MITKKCLKILNNINIKKIFNIIKKINYFSLHKKNCCNSIVNLEKYQLEYHNISFQEKKNGITNIKWHSLNDFLIMLEKNIRLQKKNKNLLQKKIDIYLKQLIFVKKNEMIWKFLLKKMKDTFLLNNEIQEQEQLEEMNLLFCVKNVM
ncbi:flagellar FliJ family protein [Buchnera aphidicola]|nr:flagellar FliJ family protein [Buchnera aphidicola]